MEDLEVAGRHEPNSAPGGDPGSGPVDRDAGRFLPVAAPTGDERVDEALTR
ncbi:hypothetical protein HKK72_36990, partial [Actinomadura sp. HBU206391]|nr:hypothetical protein [Actinomadura sp. HBU206391]